MFLTRHHFFKLPLAAALLSTTALCAAADGHANMVKIGETTALIAEASTADEPSELMDGKSGDIDFPFISRMKALATVGEVDKETGKALTGYPDGQAAWLKDENTVTVAYQSESYATMSKETYGWEMKSGATFTGSHIHTLDYDRAGLADFLTNDDAAASILKGSGHLFDTVYNVFGDEVKAKADGGVWGNQALPDGTLVDFANKMQLKEADFFFQSFCGAFFEPANKWGDGIGLANDAWFMAEEWKIAPMFNEGDRDNPNMVWEANDGMGLASMVVDIENNVAYTAPALGQTGYEKIMPLNPQHKDYVVLVLSGYNHDEEPAALKIYVGLKGAAVDGSPIGADANSRDKFLAANGLLHGKIYGMALANEDFAALGLEANTGEKMLDAYMQNADAPETFSAKFVPTSYQWGGWDKPVAVKDTEMFKWGAAEEQPEGHTYFVGDAKVEHPAVNPDTSVSSWVYNMTNKGGNLGFILPDLKAELDAAGGKLPAMISANGVRTLSAAKDALTLELGGKGIKPAGGGDHSTDENGDLKSQAPDGLMWIKGADGDVLIVDEDSGNKFGERKYAMKLNADDLTMAEKGKGYLLAVAGGTENPRAAAGASALGGAVDKARTSEFSGTWNMTALLTKKEDGSFYSKAEIAGTGEQEIANAVNLNDQTLLGVVQHRTDSAGQVAEVKGDRGGQIFMFKMNLPE